MAPLNDAFSKRSAERPAPIKNAPNLQTNKEREKTEHEHLPWCSALRSSPHSSVPALIAPPLGFRTPQKQNLKKKIVFVN